MFLLTFLGRFTAKGLIDRMQAMETFTAQFGNETNGAKEEYEHASKFLTKKDDRNKKCGTLSQSEWDAACKYYFLEYKFVFLY